MSQDTRELCPETTHCQPDGYLQSLSPIFYQVRGTEQSDFVPSAASRPPAVAYLK
jgi:hypothetical protein